MIFHNPRGGPELACDECGCRWFDRRTMSCYECGAPVPPEEVTCFNDEIARFHREKGIVVNEEKEDKEDKEE